MYFLQTSQVQFSSSGRSSSLYCIFSMLIFPWVVKSPPCREFIVGNRESKQSIPKAIASSKSSGLPTPIKYLGLSLSICCKLVLIVVFMSSLPSPMPSPPSATPSKLSLLMCAALCARRSWKVPP